MKNEILVTGLGVVSPIGSAIDSYWASINHETRNPNRVVVNEGLMKNTLFYEVPDRDYYIEKEANITGNTSAFAISACREAILDSSLDLTDKSRIGISLGTGGGDMHLLEEDISETRQLAFQDQFQFQMSSNIASELKLNGPCLSVSTACSAGLHSISLGIQALENGWADVMLVGGAEGQSKVVCGAFDRLGLLDSKHCRSFDQKREGTILGEGAAVMVIETKAHAEKRGYVKSYAKLKGYGWSCDAHHITAPESSGGQAKASIHKALVESGLSIEDLGAVVLHGTGTDLNDSIESTIMEEVFGDYVHDVAFTAVKPKIGHGAGASGAFGCLTAVLALRNRSVPPCGNLDVVGPEITIPILKEKKDLPDLNNVLVNAYAFGGNNMSLILGR